MSTKKERFAEHVAALDSYIMHQMEHRTEAERQAFRQQIIARYNDKIALCSERLQRALRGLKK